MRGECVYLQVLVQMYLRGLDSRRLSERAGMNYTSLRRKLRGQSPLQLEEARRIRAALQCDVPLEDLFERREDIHDA